ncbi:MAG: processing protein [Clostridiales bacterium]|jgi:DNA processing protein|nr:processing protein [Clostridiales bacterium]MDN5281919.1 processing protein [Candidatus Ozemobacter sp.]
MIENLEKIKSAIYLSRMPGVGAARFASLMKKFTCPIKALEFYRKNLPELLTLQSREKEDTSGQIAKTLEMIEKEEIFCQYFSSEGYPEPLADLTEPPPVLFSSRPLQAAQRFAAVVGARNCDANMKSVVERVVAQLAEKGYTIVSGGAKGIDSLAHRAALHLSLPTVAVFGTGLDKFYPAENRELFENMVEGGGNLLTEFLCGTDPRRGFFPTRNRIIAGLSEVVVVIQAARKSGSLITARWAMKLNRKLYVKKPVDYGLDSWAGNRLLEELGAKKFVNRLRI